MKVKKSNNQGERPFCLHFYNVQYNKKLTGDTFTLTLGKPDQVINQIINMFISNKLKEKKIFWNSPFFKYLILHTTAL